MRAAADAIRRARARARAHVKLDGDFLERGEIQGGQLCVFYNLTHAWPRASSAAGEARRDARGCAGVISRARARARAHLEMAADGLELGELQLGQLCVLLHLTHAWPRASSAVSARCARLRGRAQPSAGEGARAPRDRRLS